MTHSGKTHAHPHTDRLLERFLRYVRVHTTSEEDSTSTPSTERQLDLGRMLVAELQALGLSARLDEHGYVYATLPANLPVGHPARGRVPAIGFVAHMDTSPDAPGLEVRPQVIRGYRGGDIVLPGDPSQVIRAAETPELAGQIGKDLITTDGTTLLGADDKAGIAEILEAVQRLLEEPTRLHGDVQIAFTPDEEIGRGADKFDVPGFGARVAYTLDGDLLGKIEDETFNAHAATFALKGYNVHPGSAKDKMINTLHAAAEIIRRLPADMRPETTAGRQGYLHPHRIDGTVDTCTLKLLIRDHDLAKSREKIALLERIAADVRAAMPGVEIELTVRESYLNMKPKLDEDPRIVRIAMDACRAVGVEPFRDVIRGGTDGARLCYMGILTPNVFTGGWNYHSVREWASLQDMEMATQVVMKIAELWVTESVAG